MEYFTGEQAVHDPETMNRIHERGREILDEFAKTCDEYRLKYYLAGDSLL